MGLVVHQVDAFTAEAFGGNPAAVIPLAGPRDETWMQNVAREMSLSETAFVAPGEGAWNLRWFTPSVEVELCGHATLATAHVLWETGAAEPGHAIAFDTRCSGRLIARQAGEWIEMDFPAHVAAETPEPEGLSRALGVRPAFVGFANGNHLVEVESDEALRGMHPDFTALARNGWAAIVTARGTGCFDFVSRYFAPSYGIDEDPATGSAHCSLAPHWARRLERDDLTGFQASERGGVVRVRIAGDRVFLGGQAVTVMRGELTEAAAQAVPTESPHST